MAVIEALRDPSVLAPGPVLEFQDHRSVVAGGGVAVLPWRAEWLAATAAGVDVRPDAEAVGDHSFDQAVVHVRKGRAPLISDLRAAWRCLRVGGRLLVCGDNDLGIASVLKRLARESGQEVRLLAQRGHGRIGVFERRAGASPFVLPPACTVPLVPGSPLMLVTAPGVFSADALDEGTALLLTCLDGLPAPRAVLDLGCGAGHLGIAALVRWPEARALLVDADHRAVVCARANLARLGLAERANVQWWDAREPLMRGGFDLALLNPPFHRDVRVDLRPARAMLHSLNEALSADGRALIVANRTLPYETMLTAGRWNVQRQQGGYKIIAVTAGGATIGGVATDDATTDGAVTA